MKTSRRMGADITPSTHTPGGGTIQGVKAIPPPPAQISMSVSEALRAKGVELDTDVVGTNHGAVSHSSAQVGVTTSSGDTVWMDCDIIEAGRYQPRLRFDDEDLQRLADTLATPGGQNNAITVRPKGNGRYEVIGGERRLRATILLGRRQILVRIRDLTDAQAAVMALVDNDSAVPLSDYESGLKYRLLLDEGIAANQMQLSRLLGESMSTVSRRLRYFELPEVVLDMLNDDPRLIGPKIVADLASFTKQGFDTEVVDAVAKIRDNKQSQEAALNWLKAEIRRKKDPSAPVQSRTLAYNGKSLADIKIDGRKLILACPKGVNPEDLLATIEKQLALMTSPLDTTVQS